MTNPDEKVDAMLRDMFGDDPAGAVMSQTKISTAPFSLDAPPVVKNTIPVNTGKPDFDLPEDNEPQSPFIHEPSQSLVTEDGSIEWSDESANLVEVFDILQAVGFKYIAGATEEEKEQFFSFSEKDKKRLAKFTQPIAQKHNIRVPKEISLLTALAEIMARNTSKALDMRKEKEEKAQAEAKAATEQAKTAKLQAVKSEDGK